MSFKKFEKYRQLTLLPELDTPQVSQVLPRNDGKICRIRKAVVDGPVSYVMLQKIVGISSRISVRETRTRVEVNNSLSLSLLRPSLS
jgi:hypothetical protein